MYDKGPLTSFEIAMNRPRIAALLLLLPAAGLAQRAAANSPMRVLFIGNSYTYVNDLPMVIADLAGSYNNDGIRRWFDRPRQQLKGASPRQFLEGSWTPNSTEALRIKELSTAVV